MGWLAGSAVESESTVSLGLVFLGFRGTGGAEPAAEGGAAGFDKGSACVGVGIGFKLSDMV